jgi:hypothetical protein
MRQLQGLLCGSERFLFSPERLGIVIERTQGVSDLFKGAYHSLTIQSHGLHVR